MFRDRSDAGERLGAALIRHKGTRSLVLGIPRGGVAIAYEVARAIASTFSILVVRKLPFPDNPEAGFGAVAEDGALYLIPGAGEEIPQSLVDLTIRQQQVEVIRRVKTLRGGQPLPDLRSRPVILVDDGIAMGSTMQAAVMCCRHLGASRVTVASPVASPSARAELSASADELVVLFTPSFFRAVAEFYEQWYDVPDGEVADIMSDAAAAGLLATPAPRPELWLVPRQARDPGTGHGGKGS